MKRTTKARLTLLATIIAVVAATVPVVDAALNKALEFAGNIAQPLSTELSATPTNHGSTTNTLRTHDNTVNLKPLTAAPIRNEILLERTGYTASYNPDKRQPNYVAWTLTAERTYGNSKREKQFYEDDQLLPDHRSLLSDYYNSGYSRGHMCPAADNKWSDQAMRESFLLSNICPQTQSLNGGDWEELEAWCRKYVRSNQVSLHIICGPIFTSQPPTLKRKRLYVPDQFFKAIICISDGEERGIAFVYDNGTQHHPMSHYTCTIRDVERLTGLNLFHKLPRKQQDRLETHSNLDEWQS